MASNSFGRHFRITTWGESHGKALGVVIDGCPPNLEISEEEINEELAKRAPGNSPYTSPRKEADVCEILSGVFEGKTTGTPISILIPNRDANPSAYAPLKKLHRPGHASFTYLEKYGIYDHRGGGRASARETVGRVAAGAIAKKWLRAQEVEPKATLIETGDIEAALANGDSVGGLIEVIVPHLPTGLGDPIYEKIEARLAHAMLSIPASKGFEMGAGFAAARMCGSEHNDAFTTESEKIVTTTNHAGGTLAGITNGMPLVFRVPFKPTSSIKKPQQTVTHEGEATTLTLDEKARHDPCVAIRAVPIVEAMTALVLIDCYLLWNLTPQSS